MSWPKEWKRQDIGSSPGVTDGTQHVYIDGEVVRSYGAVKVPVEVLQMLLELKEAPEGDEPGPTHDAHMVTWTESERGWGSRPDGLSLHLTSADAKRYIADYWREEKKRNPSGEAPDEYSRPDSEGRPVLVSTELYDQIRATKNGLRVWSGKVSQLEQSGDLQRLK